MSLVDRLKVVVEAFPEVELAVLFGSTARGHAKERSDVDVAVRLGNTRRREELQEALSRAARADVDLVELDEAPPLLRFEIARDGVVLLERERWAWADARRKAMTDWWEFAPTARIIQRAAARRVKEQAALGAS